jgi:hypothetical protein
MWDKQWWSREFFIRPIRDRDIEKPVSRLSRAETVFSRTPSQETRKQNWCMVKCYGITWTLTFPPTQVSGFLLIVRCVIAVTCESKRMFPWPTSSISRPFRNRVNNSTLRSGSGSLEHDLQNCGMWRLFSTRHKPTVTRQIWTNETRELPDHRYEFTPIMWGWVHCAHF